MLLFEFICILWMSSSITEAPVPDEVVDMSYSYDESTLGWPGQRKFRLKIIHNGTAAEGYWFQAEEFVMATHIGTHLDAPCHFAKGKWSVEELPLNHLMAPAAVIDISNKSEVDNDTLVQIQDLEKWERLSGQSLDATIVLIRSGWGTHWPDKKNFTG
ncbi:Kynurenine formamidase, partial [Stegodyphus mimosarum]